MYLRTLEEGIRFVRGRVNPSYIIIEALKLGADGVLIVGCHEQDCQHGAGRIRANERINRLKVLLKEVGINPEKDRYFRYQRK